MSHMNSDLQTSVVPTKYWHRLDDGRVQCDLCPRLCKLHEGQRGFCFVRARQDDQIVLTTYGRSSGYCVDPIEKKPLYHFLPGTPVLSFGTAGCNLGCKFCQNWDISKSREVDTLADSAGPERIAEAAERLGCRSVAFTYNDPVIFHEYAIDVADACRDRGIRAVAVTAGEVCAEPRAEFYRHMDAANVDLKAFTEEFYRDVAAGHLGPVLETLEYLKHETSVWFELTTLLIPGKNDSDAELDAMTELGRRPPRPRRADALLRLPPRLPDDRRAGDPAGDPPPGPADRPGERGPPRLRRQRPRPGGRQHDLPRLRGHADRPRLVRADPLAARPRRPLPRLRDPLRRRLRAGSRHLGPQAAPGPAGERRRAGSLDTCLNRPGMIESR